MTPERMKRLTDVLAKRQFDLTIVLENVTDPHNISAVMRTCDAVGIQEIHILNTRIPRHKKWGSKSSSSADKWLTIHQYTDLNTCVQGLKKSGFALFSTHLSADAVSLHDMDLTRKIALVFGNEHSGVSEEMLAVSDGNFIIPQVGIIRSLNISVACAVTIYEAFRQKSQSGHYHSPNIHSETYKTLQAQWALDGQSD